MRRLRPVACRYQRSRRRARSVGDSEPGRSAPWTSSWVRVHAVACNSNEHGMGARWVGEGRVCKDGWEGRTVWQGAMGGRWREAGRAQAS